jgi:hypothetical protein
VKAEDIQYRIVAANENVLKSAIHIASSHFPEDHSSRNLENLRWLYLNNPSGVAMLVIAEVGAIWVGMLALVPVALRINGQKQAAYFAANVMTHPKHRNANIFIKLIKISKLYLCLQNSWLIGHPNKLATPGWRRQKMEFRYDLRLSLLVPCLGLRFLREQSVKTIDELARIPWNKAVTQSCRDGLVRIEYTAEYLKWRYLDAPLKRYHLRCVFSDLGEFRGFYVEKKFWCGTGVIVDYMFFGKVTLSPFKIPKIILVPSVSSTCNSEFPLTVKLPLKKSVGWFMSTWGVMVEDWRCNGITLGASDF